MRSFQNLPAPVFAAEQAAATYRTMLLVARHSRSHRRPAGPGHRLESVASTVQVRIHVTRCLVYPCLLCCCCLVDGSNICIGLSYHTLMVGLHLLLPVVNLGDALVI